MTYSATTLSKFITTVGICFFAINALVISNVLVRAQDPSTPNTPGMGIPINATDGVAPKTSNNSIAPVVPVPKSEVVDEGAMIIARPGSVTPQNFKNGSDVVNIKTNGVSNELKASDLTIQKSVESKTKSAVETVRTGAVPVFLLIVAPIAVMLWYQYRFIRSKKTSLATTEEKIKTQTLFDKK